jgi:hypothetical protein
MTTMTTIYQVTAKGQKVAKINAKDLPTGLGMLFNGLKSQNKIGKRWLTLAKGCPIFVQGMDASGYLKTQKIVPAKWTQAEALEAIQYLLSK